MTSEAPFNILVTGANGDIGRAVVALAISKGHCVFACLRDELQQKNFVPNERLRFLKMDLENVESVRSAYRQLDVDLAAQPLNCVIHCAAIQSPSCVEFMDPAHLEQTLRVNTIGTMVVMQEAFGRLRTSRGNLVIASSLWGLVSGPAVAPYAPSKWALEALIHTARCETRGMGFHITTVNIGAVRSKMLDAHVVSVKQMVAGGSEQMRSLYGERFAKHIVAAKLLEPLAATVVKVACTLLKIAAKQQPRTRYTLGIDAKVVRVISWLLPQRVMDKILSG
ncbi:MAG: SDR family NAD(P)-dependent oxidoreductase [Pseudomonadales bacterium]